MNQNWNSLKFPVVIGGKGQPILLLHGFDSSFLEFRRIYKCLKRNFQVIIPDLLGFGFSPRRATNEYNSSKIISCLIDLLKTLQITKNLKIVGASMGGSTALELAFKMPDSIDKIILLSPAGLFGKPKSIQNIPIKTVCGQNDRILGKIEIKNIKKIEELNFVGLQNCGHLPHIDLPSLSGKIIQDFFLE